MVSRSSIGLRILWLGWLVIAGGMFLSGCATTAPSNSRIPTYVQLKDKQLWFEALAVAREEVRAPGITTNAYQADIRTIAIGALADVVRIHGVEGSMDAEADEYLSSGLKYAEGDPARIGALRNVYVRYFSSSGRNGRAIREARSLLQYWQAQKSEIQVILTLDTLAGVSNDMGDVALRDMYRKDALARARAYFDQPGQARDPNQWLQYKSILFKRADDIANLPEHRGELDAIWTTASDITQRFLSPKVLSYSRMAVYYAMNGNAQKARLLESQGKAVWEEESAKVSPNIARLVEYDLTGNRATMSLYLGDVKGAVAGFKAAEKLRGDLGLAGEDIAFYRLLGLAYEKDGDYNGAAIAYRKSIEIAERVRSSYSVAERAAFFRSVVRRSYYGLIRVTARQALQKGDGDSTFAAIQAMEAMRARQLGDLIDANASPMLSREGLAGLRSALSKSQAVIGYTATDRELVAYVLTRSEQRVVLLPIEADKLGSASRDIAKDLANPDSAKATLDRQLQALSRDVLAPIGGAVSNKAELIVVPDGPLNLVPYDLLTLDSKRYRPLLETHRVRLITSLRGQQHPENRSRERGVFVVADPSYVVAASVGDVPRADIDRTTRGSAYLKYFKALPETRDEAAAILAAFPKEKSTLLLGNAATESAIKHARLDGYSNLHFATHGILGGEVPGLAEPALVLSAEPGEDGFLTASEVSELKLNATLAVLSACNTGSGEYVSGEGVMGMSRSFLIAGSRAVVVSLWPVASEATARLMQSLYAGIRSGQEPDAALRNAKLEMVRNARKTNSEEQHPFYWAPFQLVGNLPATSQ